MSQEPAISVVVATYNRKDILPKTLRCLARQTLAFEQFEVVVVDDGSDDGTPEVIASLTRELPISLRYLRHPNAGICHTQNRGIRAAKGRIVCLIADDIHFTPKALERHLEDHESHPDRRTAVLGMVRQSPDLPATVFHDNWDPFRLGELVGRREIPCYQFFACNVSFKKDFMLDCGMFDEELVKTGAYAHEDVELGYRLQGHGMRLLFNEEALAYHYHLVPMEKAMATAFNKGLSWPKFRKAVGAPELTVRYHVSHRAFWQDYGVLLSGRHHLMGLDASPVRLALSQMLRVMLFNVLTVPYAWIPLMRLAERNRLLAKVMHPQMYRCVISHFFHKGVARAMASERR